MVGAEGQRDDLRPEFKVAVFGLTARLQRILEIVLKHARHNQYRFTLSPTRGPGQYDIALVDMTAKGGFEVANTLRRVSASRPVVTIGRRNDPARRDDLQQATFTMQVLKVLNIVVDSQLFRQVQQRVAQAALVRLPPAGTASGLVAPTLPLPRAQASGADLRRPRTLIVDDSPTVRRQLLEALVPMGLQAEAVASAVEALHRLAQQRYGLIFVDVVMPGMDGYQFTRKLKRNRQLRSTPIVMLTSRSSPFDLVRGALAGCDSYLVKPVSLATLRSTVARHMKAFVEVEQFSQQLSAA